MHRGYKVTDLRPDGPDQPKDPGTSTSGLTWTSVQSEREQELLAEIERLNGIIESIKTQYNELMDVAQQYREEALKWYNKFLHGRRT